MVMRYALVEGIADIIKSLDDDRERFVLEKDYQSLQAALREALEGWEDSERQHDYPGSDELTRITAIRAQFLDDKEPS